MDTLTKFMIGISSWIIGFLLFFKSYFFNSSVLILFAGSFFLILSIIGTIFVYFGLNDLKERFISRYNIGK